ncbi:MAG: ATP-binding protein [Nitrospirota bacterium]
MESSKGLPFEGLLKAAILFFAVLLAVLTISSLSLISKTRKYLESEMDNRLLNISDIVSREIRDHYPESLSDPYYLHSLKLQESLSSLIMLDPDGRVIIDPSGENHRDEQLVPQGITQQEFNLARRGSVELSPIYRNKKSRLRSIYFPVKDPMGRMVAVGEAALDAGYIEDLTQQGTTYFVLKSMSVAFLLLAGLYIVRTMKGSHKRLLQMARGAPVDVNPKNRDDISFVVDTFQLTIASLKEKEKELSELKNRAEERARSVESMSETILKNIQSGVITFDSGGTVATANGAAGMILARDENSLPGKAYSALFGTGNWLSALVGKAIKEGLAQNRSEGEIKTPTGKRWIGAGISPLFRDGTPGGAVLVFTDITEVKELREMMELKERIALLGEMSAGIAHELRNPMGVISGYADFLARNPVDPSSFEAAESIRQEIKGMDEIIREFLHFSQPTELNVTQVDLQGLIDESFRALGNAGGGIKRVVLLDGNLPAIEGDAVLLRQVFINLIKNAYEAMGADGNLAIAAEVEKGDGPEALERKFVRLDFRDTGPGIDPSVAGKIFTPFFTTKPSGTGLGLSLVQKIIVYHGGKVTVAMPETGGAVFSIYLPIRAH